MKLGFTTLGCPDWTVEEVVDNACKLNCNVIELRAKAPEMHISTDTTTERIKEVKQLFDSKGITICGITGYTKFNFADQKTRKENSKQLIKNVHLAHALGASYVRTFIGYPDDNTTESEAIRRIAEAIAEAAITVSNIPVNILIETHDYASSGRITSEIIKHAGTENHNIGAIWDISHPPKMGESPAETWGYIGEFVKSVHLKDEYEKRLPNGEIHQCFPGKGILPLKEVLKLLKEKKYDGWYVIEWERAFNMQLEPLPDAFIAFRKYILQNG